MKIPCNLVSMDERGFEQLRDSVVIAARGLSDEQILELSDNLHTVLRRRKHREWSEAKQGTAGFA